MTKSKEIPVDSYQAIEDDENSTQYAEATSRGKEIRERILASPSGLSRYAQVTQEIEWHQASLAQVRKARSLAQTTVAEIMGMDQSEISRLERRSDLLLSTAKRFIQAVGGDLHLVASFPEGDFELNIGELESEENGISIEVRA